MKMHWCTARVNLAGQGFTIVEFSKHEPISWPEVQVLMALHGDENLMDIKPCKISETMPRNEKNRLLGKYGQIVERVFPGHSPRIELLMPGEPEDQPLADDFGLSEADAIVKGQNGGDDDDDDGTETKSAEPPKGPATFKPGRVPRPAPAGA